MSDRIGLRFGEFMGEGSDDPYWSEPEIAIGELDGPVGQAMATLLGQTAGFSRFFCLVDGGKQVRPVTLMVPKVQLKKLRDVEVFGGPVQAGIADGVLDAVEEGIIPIEKADDIGIIALTWVDPSACDPERDVDFNEVYESNRKSMKGAIEKALNGQPTVQELLAEDRSKPRHFYYRPDSNDWEFI